MTARFVSDFMIHSVSIVIPTYNRAELLERTLGSLKDVRVPAGVNVEILVVANACTDATVQTARACFAGMPFPCRVVEEPTAGLNVARNRAVAESRHEIVAMLDDDVLVDPHWMEGLLDVVQNHPADIIAGRIDLWWDVIQEPAWLSPKTAALLSRLDYGEKVIERFGPADLVGANFIFKRSVYHKIGPFRPELDRRGNSLMGGGETEWVHRALGDGFRLFYAPKARLKHWVAPKRVHREYLDAVSFSLGLGFIVRKPTFGFFPAARALTGYAYLALKGRLLELAGKFRNNPRAIHDARVERNIGDGGVVGSVRRLRGTPIQGKAA